MSITYSILLLALGDILGTTSLILAFSSILTILSYSALISPLCSSLIYLSATACSISCATVSSICSAVALLPLTSSIPFISFLPIYTVPLYVNDPPFFRNSLILLLPFLRNIASTSAFTVTIFTFSLLAKISTFLSSAVSISAITSNIFSYTFSTASSFTTSGVFTSSSTATSSCFTYPSFPNRLVSASFSNSALASSLGLFFSLIAATFSSNFFIATSSFFLTSGVASASASSILFAVCSIVHAISSMKSYFSATSFAASSAFFCPLISSSGLLLNPSCFDCTATPSLTPSNIAAASAASAL